MRFSQVMIGLLIAVFLADAALARSKKRRRKAKKSSSPHVEAVLGYEGYSLATGPALRVGGYLSRRLLIDASAFQGSSTQNGAVQFEQLSLGARYRLTPLIYLGASTGTGLLSREISHPNGDTNEAQEPFVDKIQTFSVQALLGMRYQMGSFLLGGELVAMKLYSTSNFDTKDKVEETQDDTLYELRQKDLDTLEEAANGFHPGGFLYLGIVF